MEKGVIAGNLKRLQARINKRCAAIGRESEQIRLIGVSKTISPEGVRGAIAAGLKDFGENKVQEGIEKIKSVRPGPTWHFIGHLQRNKAGKAAEHFDIIQSVDSVELAETIAAKSLEMNREMEIYLQLNSSGEIQKSGFYPGEILEAADKINRLSGLKLTGLMTIGPLTDDENLIRRSFSLTKEVYDRLKDDIGGRFEWLSMGMSGDFELALEYGANMLRIGTAIFGPRINP
jgi:pyridoxal phosphate enzyme (YggS family)